MSASLNYRPASPSPLFESELSGSSNKPVKIPNVLGIQSQFAPLVAIWSNCIEELRPLSRVLAKGIEVVSREAFEALPEGLKTKVEHPDKEKWDRLVAEHTDEDGCALVEVSKLAAIHGLEERAKLTPKQSQSLAQTAEYVGLVIEPDARLTNRPYSWDDVVSLLRPEERRRLPADSRYLAASLMLELGIYVAAADGSVEDVEVDQVARFLESQFLLDPPDARRLEALKRVFMARPPTLAGLGKRLQTALTREQREAVGRFLTGIAAANGIIDRKEVTALRTRLSGARHRRRSAQHASRGIPPRVPGSDRSRTRRAITEAARRSRARTRPAAPPDSRSTKALLRRIMAETRARCQDAGRGDAGGQRRRRDQSSRCSAGESTLVLRRSTPVFTRCCRSC